MNRILMNSGHRAHRTSAIQSVFRVFRRTPPRTLHMDTNTNVVNGYQKNYHRQIRHRSTILCGRCGMSN